MAGRTKQILSTWRWAAAHHSVLAEGCLNTSAEPGQAHEIDGQLVGSSLAGRPATGFDGLDVVRTGVMLGETSGQDPQKRISSVEMARTGRLSSKAAAVRGDNGSLSECVV